MRGDLLGKNRNEPERFLLYSCDRGQENDGLNQTYNVPVQRRRAVARALALYARPSAATGCYTVCALA